ncbi:hypothetical protein EDC96DRAFT_572079 [Choanephora cucurbitarum]|nr:hypothetical protein EDC96DRAFT_572079 [Choanephora cucurbitarum]
MRETTWARYIRCSECNALMCIEEHTSHSKDEVEISVETAEEAIITSVVDRFLCHFSDSTKAAKKYILGQQLELIDNEGTTKAKVVNLLNQIIMLAERKDKDIQEAKYASFVKQLLLFVFEDTSLSVLFGETGANTYNTSMPSSSRTTFASTSNGKRKIFPRKIVSLMKISKNLPSVTSSRTMLQQPVVSITWEGWNKTMFQIVDCGGFCLAKKCADLLIPSDRRLVDSGGVSSLLEI